MSIEYLIARHGDKMCVLPNCRYHIILIGDVKELLQKLDAFCFNQHVDCLYTIFKSQFIGEIVVNSGQFFDDVQSANHFNQQNRGVDRMPSIAENRLLRRKYKTDVLSSFRRLNGRNSKSVFADRSEQVKKTKFGLELI